MEEQMKLGIIGYGRMGHEIETAALSRNHDVTATFDPVVPEASHPKPSTESLKGLDAVIDFSLPQGIRENVQACLDAGVPMVIGTTGWDEIRGDIQDLCQQSNGAIVYGANFSIGAHLFFDLVGRAAALIDKVEGYDIMLMEYHHRMKKDSPSGTALRAAEKVLENLPRKTSIETGRMDGQIPKQALHVASVRGGNIPGIHTLTLDSTADSIEITHSARNRQGFALGSVMAAEWLVGKTGFYPVESFIADLLGNQE